MKVGRRRLKMATKFNDECLSKIEDNEPMFTLRAKDLTSSITVVFWILLQLLFGVVEYLKWEGETCGREKLEHCKDDRLIEAFKCALAMRSWKKHKLAD